MWKKKKGLYKFLMKLLSKSCENFRKNKEALDTFQMNYASHSYAVSLNFFCELCVDTMKVVVKYRPWRRQIYCCGGYNEGKSIVVETTVKEFHSPGY